MTAGPALKKENIAGYNCAYIHIDSIRSFDEILYVLMNGTGIGFSVERHYTEKLPAIPSELHETDTTIIVATIIVVSVSCSSDGMAGSFSV